ncbi:sensor histidine kinase, partial [Streptococcus pneumoniae]|nr:sensor histidine kinase [Streptococcus pneumoniae]
LLVAEVSDREVKQQLEQEIFKIDSYTNLVLQYLRLESFHDDLVFEKVQVEDLVKEMVRKYALFFIQKGLTVNLHDLDKII